MIRAFRTGPQRGGAKALPVEFLRFGHLTVRSAGALAPAFARLKGRALRPGKSRTAVRVVVWIAVTAVLAAHATAQPDIRQMAGQPLPSADLPNGTVTVRVVRGTISNNVSNQRVELVGGSEPLDAVTDASGRAQFESVPPGATLRAVAVVDDERLESQPFQVPAQGGIRLLLAAGVGAAQSESTAAAAPPSDAPPGEVALGSESRFILELAEGSVEVFGALEVVNLQATPVIPSRPIVFQIPAEGQSGTVLEGSTQHARVEGQRVLVTGPFAPGRTPVQFAYRVPYSGDRLRIEQRVPLPLGQLSVAVRRVSDMRANVHGATEQREAVFQGRTYLVAGGPGLAGGEAVRIDLEGLPHHPTWPLYLAVGLAALILVGAVVALVRPVRHEEGNGAAFEEQRRSLLAALVAVERQHAAGSVDDTTYMTKRASLIDALEPIYAQLEEQQPTEPVAQDRRSAADLRPKAASPDPLARA